MQGEQQLDKNQCNAHEYGLSGPPHRFVNFEVYIVKNVDWKPLALFVVKLF